MTEYRVDPMVPFVTGFLMAAATIKGPDAFKLVKTEIDEVDAFVIHLGSGLRLRVTIRELEP